ncbi:DNA methyltransferase [uncultured Exiguobacterium sp.]|uniref:DNA methyltransferase n=1 Tax=uncultured Exiguobacterium sp. TaxID=202669 RepID=UPI003748DDE6
MEIIDEILKKDINLQKYYTLDEGLNKAKLIEDLRNYDPKLIELLVANESIKNRFLIKINDVNVLKIEELIDYLQLKNYWMNSFTKYQNKIGLNTEGRYLVYNSDVVLNFPYKDCLLEGSMTKETISKQEMFFNKIIAKEEIDVLLSPKVFNKAIKINSQGSEFPTAYNNENMLIKGNNLIALYSLKERFSSKVKQIIIDPPYNTGGDGFKYNDKFNHSAWLTFMKDRLEVARELLSEDGTIWISIDDDEQAYLKVLCDEIFGRNNFVSNIIWEKRYSPTNDSKWMSDSHDFILVYAKNKEQWRPNLLPRTEKQNKYYKYDDGDGRGRWRSDNVLVKSFSPSGVYPIVNPNTGEEFYPPKGSCYRFSKETAERLLRENRLYFGKTGKGAPQLKRYLSEVKQGVTPMTIWFRDEVNDNQEAKKEINAFQFEEKFDTPKPESLIGRMLHLGSKEGDVVLDFFSGSGTTLAAAMKMNRRFIGIEQMDYINTITLPRLKSVVKGENGGISKEYDWNGGGEFIYTEIASFEKYKELITKTTSKKELECLIAELDKDFLISYRSSDFLNEETWEWNSLENMKEIILNQIDVNQLYISAFEIEDARFNFDSNTIKFNKNFYELPKGQE